MWERRWAVFEFLTFYDIWISFNCWESHISVLIAVSHLFADRTCCDLISLNHPVLALLIRITSTFIFAVLLYLCDLVYYSLNKLSTSRRLAWLSSISESRESQMFRAYALSSAQFGWRNFVLEQSLFHDRSCIRACYRTRILSLLLQRRV